ncbi:MAG: sialidase family protein [Candidatus Ratteibacteria bacterium]
MEKMIEVIEHSVIYENPIPHLVSRHAYFPGLTKLSSGDILAMFPIQEAFSATGDEMFISRSTDNGRRWIFEGGTGKNPSFGDLKIGGLKPTVLDDETLVAMGYGFYRTSLEYFENSLTGGLPDGENMISFSYDGGKTWSLTQIIPLNRPEILEVSGPCIQLRNGDLLATGATFPMWDGTRPSGRIGVVVRSKDRGKTWDDTTLFYQGDGKISPYETRSCLLPDGRIVTIVWMLDEESGKNLNNHVVFSEDNGRTGLQPLDTGIPGQASNVISLADTLLLSIHCYREGEVGLYVHIVDSANCGWKTIAGEKIWGGAPSVRIGNLDDMGKRLRFGQPSLLPLGGGEFLAAHWAVEDCLGKILAHRIRIHPDFLSKKT